MSRFEFDDLLTRGRDDVVQPSSVRSGGISEIVRISEMAYLRGALCVPHAWYHRIGTAACVHIPAVVPNMPYFEYGVSYPDSPIISESLDPPVMVDADGTIDVPTRPGLGVELNDDVVARYRVPLH